MKACGVIAEYNPFHQGHKHQLSLAKRKSQSDVMIVAMSGNFVQRGEPAIIDKWTRAKLALYQGADIVLEVPTVGAVQSSDYFAKAGVRILADAGCSSLSFGSEQATRQDFTAALQQWQTIEADLHQRLKMRKDLKQLSYPKQMATLVMEAYPEARELQTVLNDPNQQLGFTYVKAISELAASMEIFPIKRTGAGHNDTTAYAERFASGTAIRQVLLNEKDKTTQEKAFLMQQLGMTEPVLADLLTSQTIVSWEDYWPLLKYRLISWNLTQLRTIYQMNEGIDVRLKQYAVTSQSFEEFIEGVKTKRWTRTRLQRLLVYCLLGLTPLEVEQYFQKDNQAITVLGFTKQGREYLKSLKTSEVDFVTNYASVKDTFAQQYGYDEIYRLANPLAISEQNIKKIPIMDH